MHILAVSGLHVGIIFFFFQFLFSKMPIIKSSKWLYFFFVTLCLWTYAFLTGLSPSILRATFMFSMVLTAQMIQRNSNPYNTICFTAFVLLIFNPYYLFQVGFQLSFLAVFGILFFFEKIYSLNHFENQILDYFWKIICVSIACQLIVTPLSLYYFHQFPTFFLISNLPVIPLASGIIITGFITLISSPILFVFEILCYILEKGIWLLNWIINKTHNLGHIEGIYLSVYELFLSYLALVLISLFFRTKQLVFYQSFIGICLIFSGLRIIKQYNIPPASISIYDTHFTNLVLYDQKQHILIGNKELTENKQTLATTFLPNWWNEGNKQQTFISWNTQTAFQKSFSNYNLIIWKNKKILVIKNPLTKNEIQQLTPIKFEILIIQYNSDIPPLKTKQIVLDKSNTPRFCKKAIQKKPSIFCVSQEGFWQYQLIANTEL